jgi:Protein of unknown function (DUF742)
MTMAGDGADASLVRPYTRTGGRTHYSLDLPIEALVSTTSAGRSDTRYRQPEHRDITNLCVEVRSVAEVAALITVPLGVARVLISDMVGLGLVTVNGGATPENGAPDLALLERVLSGLRRL